MGFATLEMRNSSSLGADFLIVLKEWNISCAHRWSLRLTGRFSSWQPLLTLVSTFDDERFGTEEILRRNEQVLDPTYFPALHGWVAYLEFSLTFLRGHQLLPQELVQSGSTWYNFIWNYRNSFAGQFWLFLMCLGFMFPPTPWEILAEHPVICQYECLSQLFFTLSFLLVVTL